MTTGKYDEFGSSRFTPGLINDNREVTDDSTAAFLRGYMAEFLKFIGRVYTVLPRNA